MPTLLKVEPLSPTSLLTPLTTLTTCTSKPPPNLTSTSSPSVLPPSSSSLALASSASVSASTSSSVCVYDRRSRRLNNKNSSSSTNATTTTPSKYNFTTTIPILTVRDNKKNSKFICDKCPHKSYQTYNSLLRHQRVECHKDPQHICSLCSIRFYYLTTLRKHAKRMHNVDYD